MIAISARSLRVRLGLALVALLVIFASSARAADAAPDTLALIGFELIEEHPDASRHAAQQARLKMIEDAFRTEVRARGLYTMVDNTPHQPLIERVRGGVELVYRCPHCLAEIGQGMGVRYIAAGWVQKVSNLILNVNVEIREVGSNRVVLVKSVDMRGNNDESWLRAVRYLVRDIEKKRAANPRHGL